jgi:hypothetical protein
MFFCVVTRAEKQNRQHIYVLLGATSVGYDHYQQKLLGLTSVDSDHSRRMLLANFRELAQADGSYSAEGGGGWAALTSVGRNEPMEIS